MHSHILRRHQRRRYLPVALLVAILAAFLFVIDRADAADVSGSVNTAVSVNTEGRVETPPEYWTWQTIRMDINWSVKSGATVHTGDYFDVPMDPNLNPSSFVPFDLTDGSGNVVARAQIITSPAPGTIRFTFTDFVETHQNVSGNAYFRMGARSLTWPEGVNTQDIDVYNTTVRIKRDLGPDGTSDYKSGWFQPNEAQALATDQNGALLNPDQSQLRWSVQVKTQAGNPPTDWTTLTITDTPAAGSHFRCGAADLNAQARRRDSQGATAVNYPSTLVSCSAGQLVVTISKAANDHGIFSFDFNGWIDVDDQNRPVYKDDQGRDRIGFPPGGWANNVGLNYNCVQSVTRSTTVKRAAQGGSGTGDDLHPRIDIEKYSGTWDGVTFVNGVAQLDQAGQPVGLPAEDHDTAPGREVAAGASTPVTFTITNTGDEILDNVVVSDTTLTGTALTNVVCTFGGSTTMPFQGLQPGASFNSPAVLEPITAAHADRASVTAIGRISGKDVGDQDDWHAHPAPVTPPVTPPTPPVTPPVVSPATRTVLSVRKVALARSPRAGTTMSWRIEVRNRGTIAATSVRVCDPLPRALTLARPSVRIELTGAGRRPVTTGRLVMNRGQACLTIRSLAAGQTARFTMQTRISRTVVGSVRNPVNAVAANANRVSASARVNVRRAQVAAANLPAVTG